tara:strand:- start:185 stop:1624 length:1440 start_codon:yes stop_codon:yes gene_type:complete
MARASACIAVLLVLCSIVNADVYLHNPRGSNNRLNENTANRNNNNRLFDSQNNNKGGYNVGDQGAQASNGEAEQYNEQYYSGSEFYMTWTNQHAAGSLSDPNDKVRSELIVESMCADHLRNGANTNTPGENNNDDNTGYHETREWYAACDNRQRNQNLFTADQNLNGDTAIYTRQNPNGGRSGLECPEERDYYPYFIPTPWKTIGVMTSNSERCAWYKEVVDARQPELPIWCGDAPWSRDNHLGNGRSGWQNMFNFSMPAPQQLCGAANCDKCVMRLRYNISTSDYPWDLNATFNGELSPVQQNPTVNYGLRQGFKLAINTAQTGRTFQDRSHIFSVRARPNGVGNNVRIHNLVVQGKRGNIVQTFPAVEYNYMPEFLNIGENDMVHIQWTGSNTHNNNAPAGDGQAGDDGEGTGGTDRHNIVQIRDQSQNYPLHMSQTTMWANVKRSIPARTAEQVIVFQNDVLPKSLNSLGCFLLPC